MNVLQPWSHDIGLNLDPPLDAPMEAFKMIEPPSFKIGSTFCTVNRTPFTLILNILSKSSSEIFPNGANCIIPAFANKMSTWPSDPLLRRITYQGL